jgi:hypothetical protein
VKELGLLINNCTCLAEDLGKVFDVYWTLGEQGAKIPDHWPSNLSTSINMNTPMNLTLNNETFQTFISVRKYLTIFQEVSRDSLVRFGSRASGPPTPSRLSDRAARVLSCQVFVS